MSNQQQAKQKPKRNAWLRIGLPIGIAVLVVGGLGYFLISNIAKEQRSDEQRSGPVRQIMFTAPAFPGVGSDCWKTTPIDGVRYCIYPTDGIESYVNSQKKSWPSTTNLSNKQVKITATVQYGEKKYHLAVREPYQSEVVKPTIFINHIDSITIQDLTGDTTAN